ncbi:hypothetical protein R3P38DRAFT_1183697 [Favolaschia claudopus]|uniref:Uncharacterized protein n=1 Tax=Favolaschia claudopus TaxID=2862362 RepID=A0AAW0DXR4_9AGAR
MSKSTSSTTQKRPFQDITDRFLSPRKRKPKTPGGAFGEKLRLRVAEKKIFPSSLPPSSPPLYQSSSSARELPALNSEDEVVRGMRVEEDEEERAPFGHEDFGTMLPSEDGDSDAENRLPANLSDPFGFFAVERKLKAQREVEPMLVHTRYADDKERDDGLVMPPTPHKPVIGKRRFSNVVSPRSGSGTPSPVKGDGAGDSNMSASHGDISLVADEHEVEEEDVEPKKKRARKSAEEVLPMRRSTRTQSKTPAAEQKERMLSKPKKPVRKATAKAKEKGKSKVKKVVVKVETNDSEDEQEKFTAERQARLEYFKKLDDYSFEKENVYVV